MDEHGTDWLRWGSAFLAFNAAVYFFLSPNVLNPDGVEYAAYVVSIFHQHTLSFERIYGALQVAMPLSVTSRGWIANLGAVGGALFWLPFSWGARLTLAMQGQAATAAGLSMILQFMNFGSMVFGGLTLMLVYSTLGRMSLVRSRTALCAATLIGTPLFTYSFVIGTTSHAASALATGLCLWCWIETDGNRTPWGWFVVGMLAGLAGAVRTQEALVLIPPLIEWAWRFKQEAGRRRSLWIGLGCLCLGAVVGFSPQALIWKFLYGSFLHSPQAFNLSLGRFALGSCLFSSFHGLLTWTPIYGFALAGLVGRSLRGDRRALGMGPLLAAQLLVNACSLPWWEGYSFGLRQMTGMTFVAGIGLAYFLDLWRPLGARTRRWALGALALGALWTGMLALQNEAGVLDLLLYLSPRDLVKAVFTGWKALTVLVSLGAQTPSFWLCLFTLELTAIGWLAACFRKRGVLGASLLMLIAYSWIAMAQASHASKPSLAGQAALDERQLVDFNRAEACQGMALYLARRGEFREAKGWFDEAEALLPRSPVTEPWSSHYRSQRQSFHAPGGNE